MPTYLHPVYFYVILKTAFVCLKHQTDSPSSFIFQLATSTGCRFPVSSRIVSTDTSSASGPLGVYSFLSRHLTSKQLPTHTHKRTDCDITSKFSLHSLSITSLQQLILKYFKKAQYFRKCSFYFHCSIVLWVAGRGWHLTLICSTLTVTSCVRQMITPVLVVLGCSSRESLIENLFVLLVVFPCINTWQPFCLYCVIV